MQFKLNWKLTLFCVLLLPILLTLAVWQLHRADEKTKIIEQRLDKLESQVVDLSQANLENLDTYQSVRIKGSFDQEQYWLQEAKIVAGKPGYNVIMPFKTSFGVLLVDRGWLIANPDRNVLPQFSDGQKNITLEGILVEPNQVALINEADNPLRQWPHRILSIDIDVMSEQYKKPLKNRVITLSEYDVNAFTVVAQTVNMKPEKHRAYAFQWFGMAMTLCIMWLLTNTNLLDVVNKKNKG